VLEVHVLSASFWGEAVAEKSLYFPLIIILPTVFSLIGDQYVIAQSKSSSQCCSTWDLNLITS
jgi:hypothetical protein